MEIESGSLDTLETLLEQGYPPIVFVRTNELPYWDDDVYHAVVLAGVDEAFVYLYDPAFANAPQRTTIGDFYLAWLHLNTDFALIQPQ